MKQLLPLLSLAFASFAQAGDPVEPSMPLRKALSDGASMTLLAPAVLKGSDDPFGQPTPADKIQVVQGMNLTVVENAENLFNLEVLREVISDPASLIPFPEDKSTADAWREFKEPDALSWKHGEETVYAMIEFDRAEIAYVTSTSKLAYGLSKDAYKKLTKTLLHTEMEEPPKPLKIATLEEAVPYLKLLEISDELSLYEGFPRRSLPASDEAVRSGQATNFGDFYFRPGARVGEKNATVLKTPLLDKDALHPWSDDKECEGFHPDHAIEWKGEGHSVKALICFGCGEIILLHDQKKLRYDLDIEAQQGLKEAITSTGNALSAEAEAIEKAREERFKEYRKNNTPVEATEAFRAALREGAAMRIHEGLPHPAENEVLDAELKRKDVEKIGGHAFYTPARDVSKNAELRKILSDAKVVERWVGVKECGEFHPDYAVSWETGGKTVYFLACFGCSEIEYISEGKTTRYDMGELREPMTEALKTFRLKRPVPKAEE